MTRKSKEAPLCTPLTILLPSRSRRTTPARGHSIARKTLLVALPLMPRSAEKWSRRRVTFHRGSARRGIYNVACGWSIECVNIDISHYLLGLMVTSARILAFAASNMVEMASSHKRVLLEKKSQQWRATRRRSQGCQRSTASRSTRAIPRFHSQITET